MKLILCVISVCLIVSAVTGLAEPAPQGDSATSGRLHLPLTGPWKFEKADLLDAGQPEFDDADWQTVSVPHTWNNLDGQDGGDNYLAAACWYRRHVTIPADWIGKSLFIRSEGANRQCTLFVNGQRIGEHIGGFAAFCFDVTKAIKAGDNLLAIRVSNKRLNDSPPLTADFTFFGGLYRPLELLALPAFHINPCDNASPGVAIQIPRITDASADVIITSQVENSSESAQHGRLAIDILDAASNTVARSESPLNIDGQKTLGAQTFLSIPRPHRWNGRLDPYLYTVRVTVTSAANQTDQITQPLGIRTFSIDEKQGFILNGQPYDLHGVNRHQDRPGKGWAISDDDVRQDMALMKEMGCTGLRLAHYQQCDLIYRLADEAGMVVWAEVPVINELTNTAAFRQNAQQQLTELIRQNINHPSICFWSMGNEVTTHRGDDPATFFKTMSALARQEDSSRLTTVAYRPTQKWPNVADTYAENPYFGWYEGTWNDLEPWLAQQPKPLAFSEYGAGASIYFHSENPVREDHTEEYQCLFHEAHWAVIKRHPEIWGKFIWNMFDFSCDSRAEGDHAGRNDKGLVTYDRLTPKDAFYFYQANWSADPMLHLNSKRFSIRGQQSVTVRAYSNAPQVELRVNTQSLGYRTGENGAFIWPGVKLAEGENHIELFASKNQSALHDECIWTYKPDAPTEIYVAQDSMMRAQLQKGPPRSKEVIARVQPRKSD